METFVYCAKDIKELKKVLESDTLSDTSFSRLGYILREGKPYGLEGYVLYFQTEDGKSAAYQKQLEEVPNCMKVSETDKTKVVDGISSEENNAASGFGSLFG